MADTAQYCGTRVVIHPPGGVPIEVPIEEIPDYFPVSPIPPPTSPTNPLPVDPGTGEPIDGERWVEVDRATSTVSVDGVSIERIESVRMRRPNGTVVELVFRN